MSEKLGWFKFYPGDWARDLEEHPPEIEGYWIRICCKLSWEPERGRATKSLEQWARVMRVIDLEEARRVISYLANAHIADVQGEPWQDGGAIAIMSRRMVRDERERRANAVRQERHRQKKAASALDNPDSNRAGNGASNGNSNEASNGPGDADPTPQNQESEQSKDLSPPAPSAPGGAAKARKQVPKLAAALDDEDHHLHGLALWFAEILWPAYPPRRGRKAGKAEAWEWLARKQPDADGLKCMEAKLREDLASQDWQRGIGIKDCHRWLKAGDKNGWESATQDCQQWLTAKQKNGKESTSAPPQQREDPYEGLDD